MSFQAEKVAAFYDRHDRTLLADYVRGNPRIVAAIEHAIRHIPASARQILDIGCGIGWSSREIAAHFPAARVTALDLSQHLIELAQRLDGEVHNVHFQAQDVLSEEWTPTQRFQAIVLLDVYEHIPAPERARFHARLARLLDEEGLIILTCPSPRHQQHLRQHQPGGLQPVDEDVDEAAAQAMASDVGGRLAHFEYKTIWNPGDYSHIVITRARRRSGQPQRARLEPRQRRRDRLARCLNLRVTNSGLIVRAGAVPLVCWAAEPPFARPGTYAGELLSRLPFSVRLINGRPELRDDEGESLITRSPLVVHLARRAARRLRPNPGAVGEIEASIARYLRQHKVDVLATQSGVSGVEMVAPARAAAVPLVVRFCGRDAFSPLVVEGVGRRFPELFEQAQAIVVPSEHMRRQLLALGAPNEKLVKIFPGPDFGIFEPADPAAAPPLFLCAAPLVEKSGLHLLVVAMAQVLAECPEARLTIIGDGPLSPVVQQLISSMGIGHTVEMLPWQGMRYIAIALRQCRALVHPAITAADGDCDAVPYAVLEAQAAGVPVIATRHGAIPEMVQEGHSALLVEEQDVSALADHMVRLARHPDEAAALGHHGREKLLSSGLSFEATVAQWAALLRSAVAQIGN